MFFDGRALWKVKNGGGGGGGFLATVSKKNTNL